MNRITCILGHYGSGKTEFALNLAFRAKDEGKDVVLCDLDIANPYFRSREYQKLLEEKGIKLYSNSFGYDISEDLPAVSASIKVPLQNKKYTGILDVGGDDLGSRVLNQYRSYLKAEDTDLYCVINGNRPETDSLEGVIKLIKSIEEEIKLPITGLVSNTHMANWTTIEDLLKGVDLCKNVTEQTGIPLIYTMAIDDFVEELSQAIKEKNIQGTVFPVKLFARPHWLNL
ncbi:MAG: ATP-binding protein [Anaerovoracaceae bacterium]|jgi:hypothetical protein|nr:ATP-binding protein [Anaerovoracaceae bacterium]